MINDTQWYFSSEICLSHEYHYLYLNVIKFRLTLAEIMGICILFFSRQPIAIGSCSRLGRFLFGCALSSSFQHCCSVFWYSWISTSLQSLWIVKTTNWRQIIFQLCTGIFKGHSRSQKYSNTIKKQCHLLKPILRVYFSKFSAPFPSYFLGYVTFWIKWKFLLKAYLENYLKKCIVHFLFYFVTFAKHSFQFHICQSMRRYFSENLAMD
jgi:hypothetical protein